MCVCVCVLGGGGGGGGGWEGAMFAPHINSKLCIFMCVSIFVFLFLQSDQ